MKIYLIRLTQGLLQNKMLLRLIKVGLQLAIVAVCLFGYVLNSQSGIFYEIQTGLLSLKWMLLVCLAVWSGTFLLLDFSLNDLPLLGLLLIAISAYFISYGASWQATDAIILLAGVTLGKGARVLLRLKAKGEMHENMPEFSIQHSAFSIFLIGLVLLLAFSSWWHLDMANNFYHGPHWMGLWDNPNDYGMLMGAGGVLAIGLLAQNLKSEKLKAEIGEKRAETGKRKLLQILKAESKKQKLLVVFLLIAAGMMGVGLLFSYSRGAWLGTAVGLLYLAKAHGKFKWRFVLPGFLVVAAVVFCFWHSTADTGPWYLKRMDLSRPSAQHRVAAWRGGGSNDAGPSVWRRLEQDGRDLRKKLFSTGKRCGGHCHERLFDARNAVGFAGVDLFCCVCGALPGSAGVPPASWKQSRTRRRDASAPSNLFLSPRPSLGFATLSRSHGRGTIRRERRGNNHVTRHTSLVTPSSLSCRCFGFTGGILV
jgi:hypothetical protein